MAEPDDEAIAHDVQAMHEVINYCRSNFTEVETFCWRLLLAIQICRVVGESQKPWQNQHGMSEEKCFLPRGPGGVSNVVQLINVNNLFNGSVSVVSFSRFVQSWLPLVISLSRSPSGEPNHLIVQEVDPWPHWLAKHN
jgi:hypothetical protein